MVKAHHRKKRFKDASVIFVLEILSEEMLLAVLGQLQKNLVKLLRNKTGTWHSYNIVKELHIEESWLPKDLDIEATR